MTEPSASALRAYRITCAFVGVLVLTLGTVHNAAVPAPVDPMWVRQMVFGLAIAVVGATFVSGWARRHVRTLTYALFHVSISLFALLCAANAFAPSYAMEMLFVVTVLGLGGGISSRTLAPVGACIATAMGLTLAGLLWVEDPLVDPWAYAALLVGNGTAVLALVHRRISARASLAAERERYRSIFERASDGIYLADVGTHAILDANPAYLAMTGYTLDEIRRLRIEDIVFAPPDEPPVAVMVERVRTRGVYPIGPRQHRARDGRLIDVDVSISTIETRGQGVFCAVIRDASRQREVERRLREAADRADEARQRAEELLTLKSSFLSNMSHEIRTPLTGILGYAELLAEIVEGDERAMVLAVDRGARRLMSTLNSVLDLAQLESGATPLDLDAVDVVAEAAAASDALAPLADAKGLSLHFDGPHGAVWAQAEAGAIARVLNNLIGNAIKFTEAGAVHVSVSVSSDADGVTLAVRDTGIGIPASFLPHLFDEFRQASDGHARRHEGTGLGLAISRRLVEMMGGTIEVESEAGVGTAFTVWLRAAEPAPIRAAPTERMTGGWALTMA